MSLSERPEVKETKLGMAWYYYLVFSLIAVAVLDILRGLGKIYIVLTEPFYSYYGTGLQVVVVLYGLFLIAFAVFAFVLHRKLVEYKPDAPKFVKIFYSLNAGVPFLYIIIAALITGASITVEAIISLIVDLFLLFANVKYFNKRAHLFVDKKVLFCRKCGTRLAEDSTFCHKCGTKIF